MTATDKTSHCSPKIRAALKWSSLGYLLVVVLWVMVALRLIGERWWVTATAIYFPPTAALLPLGILTPACFLFNRRMISIHVVTLLFVFLFYLKPHISWVSGSAVKKIRVMTSNVGQRKPNSVTPFINVEDPDIVAFQEAQNRNKFLRSEYPNHYVAVHDEFALVSKWPIKGAGYVPGLFSHWGYAVAWFELEYEGKPLIVYNVHMPTPRPDFMKLRANGFLVSAVRRQGVFSSKVRADYQQSMNDRVAELKKLGALLAEEKRPCVIMGDFNMPDTGYLYGVFSERFVDVFAAKGSGYGLTFPGFTRNPLSLFGPWLRLDYIFVGKQWRPLRCDVESRQVAQHLAVVADLEWIGDK